MLFLVLVCGHVLIVIFFWVDRRRHFFAAKYESIMVIGELCNVNQKHNRSICNLLVLISTCSFFGRWFFSTLNIANLQL
ncbi:hypothetical protein QVD17_07342 [Tagetes erecta]|uniref:Uncharacterized protein n=1 Tax=Tagetes erecta TaxID=13708 RepID=A0AAD8LQ40_TARER|nr:hypothetical protein QVD17_07342 [Tagetes erecta]